jgi:hypothetical protein
MLYQKSAVNIQFMSILILQTTQVLAHQVLFGLLIGQIDTFKKVSLPVFSLSFEPGTGKPRRNMLDFEGWREDVKEIT